MTTTTRRTARYLRGACLLLAAASLSAPAAAVPIPWKNCGKPTDHLSIQQYDASVWPPPVAAPVRATATIDALTGQVTNLRIFLSLGVLWIFDSGALATSAGGSFVPLPASIPVSVTSPSLPLPAGPYNTTQTFTGDSGSVTVTSHATLATQLDPPLSTNVSLAFNGTPGFPLQPLTGLYTVHVQMTQASGAEVFCIDLGIPLRSVALVNVVSPPAIPTLSPIGLMNLALLAAGCGLLAAWRAKPARG